MGEHKQKNPAKAEARAAIKNFDKAGDLYPTEISAIEGTEKGTWTAKIVFENKADEPAMAEFLEKHGGDFQIELADWGENSKRAAAEASGGGRRNRFTDRVILPRAVKKDVDGDDPTSNPRREGTHGHRSFEVLREHWAKNGGAGMPYADYIEKGGRPNDLAWDLERGHVVVDPPLEEQQKAA